MPAFPAALSLCLRHCPPVWGALLCALLMAGPVPVIVAHSAPWTYSHKGPRLFVKDQSRVVSAVYPPKVILPPNVFADARAVSVEVIRRPEKATEPRKPARHVRINRKHKRSRHAAR